ncbi:MAG: hypothetical protein IT435_20040 [Phycisphaerales bacterium]|nr:hypothetical protein [Phycisphaerales bacterium]
MRSSHTLAVLVMSALSLLLHGCASSYVTPGGPADFRALGITPQEVDAITDASIAARLNRKPAASFPAALAIVRVQAGGYYSRTVRGLGSGQFSVVTNRDVEQAGEIAKLESMPMLRGLAPMNRLVTPQSVNSEIDLRSAAADLQADMVLLYTFDTVFNTETTIPALGVITLGLFPNEQARVTSTASAAVLDTRTGYVYGVAEATSKTTQLANAWTSNEAVDQSRRRAETEAFSGLVAQIESMWGRIVKQYGPPDAMTIAPIAPVSPDAGAPAAADQGSSR